MFSGPIERLRLQKEGFFRWGGGWVQCFSFSLFRFKRCTSSAGDLMRQAKEPVTVEMWCLWSAWSVEWRRAGGILVS